MDDKMVAASVSRVASAFLAASAAAECSQTLKGLAYIIATARKSSGSVKLDPALKSCLKEETFGDVLKGVLTAAGFDISGSNVGVDLSLDLSEYSDKTSLLAQRLCVRASEILQSAVGNAEVLNALSPEGLLSWSESDQDNFNRHCQFVSCASDLLAFERERGEGGDVWQEVEEVRNRRTGRGSERGRGEDANANTHTYSNLRRADAAGWTRRPRLFQRRAGA